MKYSLWVELYLAERYIRNFYNAKTLKKLGITSTECIILYFLIELNEKVSFYKLNKILPIESKQLHLTIKKLIEKKYLKREFVGKSSKIWVSDHTKKRLLSILLDNYSLVEDDFSKEDAEKLFITLNEFNHFARKSLNREEFNYGI